jgi:tetratricopeptide (TPR) repeat protein
LAIAQEHGDRSESAYCLRALGDVAFAADDSAQALSLYEKSLAHYRALEDGFSISAILSKLAETYRLLGEPEKAIASARQSLDLSRKIGDRFWAASSLVNTGAIALYTGNYTEAEGYVREANVIYRETGYRVGIASTCVVLARLAFLRASFEVAETLARQALEIATELGHARIVDSVRGLGLHRWAKEALGADVQDEEPDLVLDGELPTPTAIDRYRVIELLRLSSIPIIPVYLAQDPDSGCRVALKAVQKEKLSEHPWIVPYFQREAEILQDLQHPALLRCYGYGETADYIYVVLELFENITLKEALEEQNGFLSAREVIDWVVQICGALVYLHSQEPAPIIYRDMKPSTVGVEPNGKVRLIDFGIAKRYQPAREQAMIGTAGYASPEQWMGYSDARSDVYAVGATLHHLLTRRDPYKEKPFTFHDAPPRSLNLAVSERLEAVVLKAVEHNPENRYQSAAELKAALLACLR